MPPVLEVVEGGRRQVRAVLADRALGDERRGTRGCSAIAAWRLWRSRRRIVKRARWNWRCLPSSRRSTSSRSSWSHGELPLLDDDRCDSRAARPDARAQHGRRVRVPQLGGLSVQAGGDGRLRARGARRRRALRRPASAGSPLGTGGPGARHRRARPATSSTARDGLRRGFRGRSIGAAGISGRSTWPMPRSRSASR